jgi:hypothetical protein
VMTVVPPCGALPRLLSDLLQIRQCDEETMEIVAAARAHLYDLVVPVTTRPAREGEEPGLDYEFVSETEFMRRVKRKQLLELVSTTSLSSSPPSSCFSSSCLPLLPRPLAAQNFGSYSFPFGFYLSPSAGMDSQASTGTGRRG